MRKVILSAAMTIDGYIARPNGDVDFLFMPKDYSRASFLGMVDTALMGRKTYEVALAMSGGSFPAPFKYYVFSQSQPAGECNGVIVTDQSPAALITELRPLSW